MTPAPRVRPSSSAPTRRRFLSTLGRSGLALTAAAVFGPAGLLADPYRPRSRDRSRSAPVRLRGRVATPRGEGVAGTAVTDGLSVVQTEEDGSFELVSFHDQPFVYLTKPSGYAFETSETGTARFYVPVTAAPGETQEVAFTLEPLPDGPATAHAFLALADPQTQNTWEIERMMADAVPSVRETVRALGERPVFGVSVGDIMFDDLSLYDEYEQAVQQMGVPFYQVVGNHDLDFDAVTDAGSSATFQQRFGPPYYSFDVGAVHYVVLDDVFWTHAQYIGYLDDEQLGWLEQDLARVEAGRPVVVFQHIPALSTRFRRAGEGRPSAGMAVSNRERLYELLAPFEAHVISGHTHETEHVFEGRVAEHVRGAVCGAWWSGPIGYDGTPNGYSVFEVDGEELRWRHQPSTEAADHQLRVYPAGADPQAPDELVANVWDWDPEWTVTWYEGADRRGAMARRVGLDPLSVALHRGSEAPARRPWVDPVPTGHLFYAPAPSDPQAPLRVEAVDRWGRAYTAEANPSWNRPLDEQWHP